MSTTTVKYGLFKPDLTDPADITQMNRNWDIIDDKLNNIPITSEVPSDAEMWIDPDEMSAEESHLTDMNNPHNVTIQQIGAAPSGYGLGEMCKSISSVFDINANGWFLTKGNTPNGAWWLCHALCTNSGNRIEVVAYSVTGNSQARLTKNTTWGDWEWVDPPMTVDVEYRTTERWQGKVVYCQAFNLQQSVTNCLSLTPLVCMVWIPAVEAFLE